MKKLFHGILIIAGFSSKDSCMFTDFDKKNMEEIDR